MRTGSFDNFELSLDSLNCLTQGELDDTNLLEKIDPDDLAEWVEDTSDSGSQGSINQDDLKEWLEVMSCADESNVLEDIADDDLQDFLECLKDTECSGQTEHVCAKFSTADSGTAADKSLDNSIIQERIAAIQKKLEVSRLRTEMSRQRFLQEKSASLDSSISPTVLGNLNDLVSGKRKCLTSNLEESRKRLKMLESNDSIHAHVGFFTGKRSALTSDLEKSRNYLKMLGGLKVQPLRPRLIDCGWQARSKSRSALMA